MADVLPSLQMWRIVFFLSLAFTGVAPVATLMYLHGAQKSLDFVSKYSSINCPLTSAKIVSATLGPVWPSLISYLIGLVFYATHIPERFIADWKLAHWLDSIGGGSHAIWHAFIVLAISQHKTAIGHMRNGIGCELS